jgi:L-aminopeptidase/D-esterase-like protein
VLYDYTKFQHPKRPRNTLANESTRVKSQSIALSGATNSLVDVGGISVGHAIAQRRLTGCTVVLMGDGGAVASVDVRGAAPGTRETELLAAENLVEKVHAIVLTGGSAFGLDAATGVMRWLDERNIGLETGYGTVPIVPAAVLFDLPLIREGDDPRARPNADTGYEACNNATATDAALGNVGAGAGATVGKLFGMQRSMKGGLGQASLSVGPWVVSALVACNAVGDVINPITGKVLAGVRKSAQSKHLSDSQLLMLEGKKLHRVLPGTNTTIGVVATNAKLTKSQAKRLAMSAHDGLARSVRPAHTPYDGDTLFSIATGRVDQPADVMLLNVMAAEVTALAIVNAVLNAAGVVTTLGLIPSVADTLK